MNEWLYRAVMAALAANILFGAYMVIAYETQPKMCLDGIVMVLNKDLCSPHAYTIYLWVQS